MKDFDQERAERAARDRDEEERTFRLGGELFTIKEHIRPEVIAPVSRIDKDSIMADDVEACDTAILGFLHPEDHDRYLALRAREEDPVTFEDMLSVVQWMVETNTARPTGAPSRSGGGREQTGTSSTDDSRSPEAISKV